MEQISNTPIDRDETSNQTRLSSSADAPVVRDEEARVSLEPKTRK
jgi:hypothetical protein